jgi:cellobiose phosphorylase
MESFKLHYRYRETTWHISVVNASGNWTGAPKIIVDGLEQAEPEVSLVDDRKDHQVEVRFG